MLGGDGVWDMLIPDTNPPSSQRGPLSMQCPGTQANESARLRIAESHACHCGGLLRIPPRSLEVPTDGLYRRLQHCRVIERVTQDLRLTQLGVSSVMTQAARSVSRWTRSMFCRHTSLTQPRMMRTDGKSHASNAFAASGNGSQLTTDSHRCGSCSSAVASTSICLGTTQSSDLQCVLEWNLAGCTSTTPLGSKHSAAKMPLMRQTGPMGIATPRQMTACRSSQSAKKS